MKSLVLSRPDALPLVRFRFADYVELTGPRIGVVG